MADVGSVVVVGLGEREVDEVVDHEKNGESKENESREIVLVGTRHIQTDSHPVDDRNDEVGLFETASLEFVFELPEAVFLSAEQSNRHQDGDDESSNGCESAQVVERIVGGSVSEVDTSGVGEVESVEEDESEEDFFDESLGDFVEGRRAVFENVSEKV